MNENVELLNEISHLFNCELYTDLYKLFTTERNNTELLNVAMLSIGDDELESKLYYENQNDHYNYLLLKDVIWDIFHEQLKNPDNDVQEWDDSDSKYPNNLCHTGSIINGWLFDTGYTGVAGNYWGGSLIHEGGQI